MGLKQIFEDGLSKTEIRGLLALITTISLVILTIALCFTTTDMREVAFVTLANIVFSIVGYYFGTKRSGG